MYSFRDPKGPTSNRPKLTSEEPVRVIDVITDNEHPLYDKLGKDASIGSIVYRPLSTTIDTSEEGDTQFTGQAFPLNPNIKTLPLKNEVVLIIRGPQADIRDGGTKDIAYYQTVYSIYNHPHANAYPVFDEPGSEVNIGEGIDLSDEIAPLQPYTGDTLIEGRLGQSIRMSGGTSVKNPYTDSSNKNKPFTFITNGQTNENPNKEAFIPILENIDKDPSSIYLTSDHSIPLTLANTKRDSYDNAPDEPSKYRGSQVLINAGRLTFNAKKDDILLSSANSVGINSNTINIDGKEYLCIDAEKIFIGSIARSNNGNAKQPVLLGHQVENYLQEFLEILINMTDAFKTAKTVKGDPVPKVMYAAGVSNTLLKSLQNQINPAGGSRLKSTKTFVE